MISGLIQHAKDNDLKQYFSKFGKVTGIVRSTESRRKYSRWALISFQSTESVDKVLKQSSHKILNEMVDCRRAKDFNPKDNSPEVNSPSQLKATSSTCCEVTKYSIHGLSPKTTTATLKKHFSEFGTVVDAYIPMKYGSLESKCFGYVVMSAINSKFSFNQHCIDGRMVEVSIENSRMLHEKSRTLLVSAGPEVMAKVSEQDLRTFFSRFGNVVSVRKPTDPATKKPSHYGFVEFEKCSSVDDAMSKLMIG